MRAACCCVGRAALCFSAHPSSVEVRNNGDTDADWLGVMRTGTMNAAAILKPYCRQAGET